MKRTLWFVLLIAVLALAACGTAEPVAEPVAEPADAEPVAEAGLPDLGGREIRIAIENAYLPFSYIEIGTTEAVGLDYDIWDEVCARLNCTPVYVETAWEGMIQAVADGQFDVGADGISITEDRAETVDFSAPIISVEQRLLVRLDEDRFTSMDEFVANEELVIGAQTGTSNYLTAVEFVPEERVMAFEQWAFAVQALVAGDVDAVLGDETAGQGYMGQNADEVALVGDVLVSQGIGYIYPLGSDLVEPVNMALQAMFEDGTIETLSQTYFGPDFDVTWDDIVFPEFE
ncbi:MAG: amino acid ABC transporter substrate-binding protein [Anaerolineales bacterium]|nr:amino acid ABC transporter substrate-binding protein [Anaerolineales bacterium]